jgi:hypothetical protein
MVEVIGAEKRKSDGSKMRAFPPIMMNCCCTLAQKDLLDKEGKIIMDKLSTFLESLPGGNSSLATLLQDQMSNQWRVPSRNLSRNMNLLPTRVSIQKREL